MSAPPGPVLRAEHLTVRAGGIRLVDDVSLTLGAGERVGLIGESGSGKSLTALSLLGLLPEGLTATGSVQVGGAELVGAGERQAAAVRGRQIAMVFQEPMSALNPAMRVGDQVAEAMLIHHTRPNARAAARAAIDLLDQVRLPDPASLARAYPHQLSGGQRQRVVLAIALANDPDVLLCDEPTTALDVTVAAAILDLIVAGVTARRSALLFITHDLAVVARTCQRVLVMYGGRIVEAGEVADVFTSPRHRYTQGLLAASDLDTTDERGRLAVIPGNVPPAGGFPSGCVFRDRCGYATTDCAIRPGWSVEGPGRGHACIHPAAGRPAPLQTPEREGGTL